MQILPFLAPVWLDLPQCCWPSDSHDLLQKGQGCSSYEGTLVSQEAKSIEKSESFKLQAMETSPKCHILGFSHIRTFWPSASDLQVVGVLLFGFFFFEKWSFQKWGKELKHKIWLLLIYWSCTIDWEPEKGRKEIAWIYVFCADEASRTNKNGTHLCWRWNIIL